MTELTRLVVFHFSDALKNALRAACEELLGPPIPPEFIIDLDGTAHQTPRTSDQPPRKAQTQGTRPHAPERDGRVQRLRRSRKGKVLHGNPATQVKAKVG